MGNVTEGPEQDGTPPPAGVDANDNLTARTVAGVRWAYTESVVGKALTLVSAAVLARLLPPRDFGLIAMAGMAIVFVRYFARMGLTRAIVQRPSLTRSHVRAGWTSSLGLGLVAFGIVWVIAPFAAVVFDEPAVTPVLRLMSLSLPLAATGMTAEALMERRMAFGALAIRSIVCGVFGLIVAIVLALRGYGVYALVIAALASTAFKSLLSYLYVRHDVRPTVQPGPYRDLLAYGSRSSLINVLEYLGHDLDTLLIGRWAGTTPLGLYNRADMLVSLPAQTVATNLSRVLFPAFSAIQGEIKRLRRAYLRAIEITAALVVPICAGIAVAAPEVIEVVLGSQWTDAAPFVPYLAVAAAASVITHFAGVLCDARAMLNHKIVLTVGKVALLAALLLLASTMSELFWFAAAIAAAEIAALGAYTWLATRILQTRWSRALGVVVRPLVAAAAVGGAIAAVRLGLLAVDTHLVAIFVAEVATGAVVLAGMVRWGALRSIRDELLAQLARAGVLTPEDPTWRLVTSLVGSTPSHDRTQP